MLDALSRPPWSRVTLGAAILATVVGFFVLTAGPTDDAISTVGATSDGAVDGAVDGAADAEGQDATVASTPDGETPDAAPTATVAPTTTTLVPPDGATAADRRLTEVEQIGGQISPKSVVSNQHGLFFAQNMMYNHTITVYDRTYTLVKTIDDRVDLPSFGHTSLPGGHQGAPVEAVATKDGAYMYVSNYEMYGPGLPNGAGDGCDDNIWPDSYVYRIPTATLEIDQVIRVGAVPKYVALTPDDRYLLVSNWCSFDVSVIDTATQTAVARIEVGRHPRGIAVSPDGTTAYVAVMGASRISVIDLTTLSETGAIPTGRSPRHLVISPDGTTLYLTENGTGKVVKIDAASGNVLASVATGTAPRSMDISDDGTALYVVNYESGTMSKVRTYDMTEIEEHPTGYHPIGITYDWPSRQVWVANYGGVIQVFQDALAP